MILSGAARLAGVMGWPVAHSLSPRLHGYWLQHHGIDGAYLPLPVEPDAFAKVLDALASLGFRGVNVTLPHKLAALAACDSVDPVAERIGAVNTIVFEDGKTLGANSDAFGFLAHLRQTLPAWRAEVGPAVVLGAGGAARAVAVALIDAGAPEVRVANRTAERAAALAKSLGGPVTTIAWPPAGALAEANLLVNTTSLGMTGQPPLALDLGGLPAGAAVYDIVYNPLETALLAAARRHGNPVVDGLGMLLHQARPGFARWFGVEPEVTDDLRRFVLGA
ncbi:MAG: shikimate dehydrogenase [Kiloniellales bacterium]|nr:shikimate dehydrogenase [Kiloniellales bacterium]